MPRWLPWPGSLVGRVGLILFVALALAHVLSFGLVVVERGLAMRGMMLSYLASDVASSVAMLERLPAADRAAWLPRLARPNYRFVLEPAAGAPVSSAQAEAAGDAVAAALVPPRPVLASETAEGGVRLRLLLDDGTPLGVELGAPRLQVSPWAVGVLLLQLGLLAMLSWLAVRVATKPLRVLADAADNHDPARQGQPVPIEGPTEVTRAATAFNTMQERIRGHLDERMRILAAVSHDLQTPITRLRLRADLLDDAVLRDKLHGDLAEMQALVGEGLAYARSAHAASEPEHVVDLGALLDSIACDYTDAGQAVQLQPVPAGMVRTRPQALRRIICNLVDNALKFAGSAEIEVDGDPARGVTIRVLDRGPGIAAGELQAVIQPFYRVENSRSRVTGGTGLGLAIAQQLAESLGARLTLAARDGGGLEATLALPPGGTAPSVSAH
ncbi:HAMP domain-containing histidine kinase [Caenimonas sedimenti]|uniref:histidine kinase n=1 Tax=Caenimonas sedimenti TaxID=2596921 RepID=A0A562ZHQ6_9BURK|nr:HAMP domain-containing sensor histidine kinase [Caenimonas sedimenti]TWO67724.1 HAMP domain-containing histidine kinase [Caenimonas sedimenti]